MTFQISVSSEGHVWAIDEKEKIWYRKGANNQFALGTGWKMVSGNLKQISVGKCGVWGVNSDYQVWFRLNTFGDPETDGTGWMRIDGRFQQVRIVYIKKKQKRRCKTPIDTL